MQSVQIPTGAAVETADDQPGRRFYDSVWLSIFSTLSSNATGGGFEVHNVLGISKKHEVLPGPESEMILPPMILPTQKNPALVLVLDEKVESGFKAESGIDDSVIHLKREYAVSLSLYPT